MASSDKREVSRGSFPMRTLFGATIGVSMGAMLGMMDVTGLFGATKSRTSAEKAKIITRTTILFGGFGTLYQGTRHLVDVYRGKSGTENAVMAGFVSLLPFTKVIISGKFNLAYAVGMIVFDEFNDYQRRQAMEDAYDD